MSRPTDAEIEAENRSNELEYQKRIAEAIERIATALEELVERVNAVWRPGP